MQIDKAIRQFALFLDNSWTLVSQLLIERDYTTNENSFNDWMQANWELLVERKVLEVNSHLEIYGAGADYNGASSRITDPDALPNFKVIVKPKNDSKIPDILNCENVVLEDVIFEKLVGFKDGFYTLEPEFKFLLITDNYKGLERVVALKDVEFRLGEL